MKVDHGIYAGGQSALNSYKFLDGSKNVIISAPHCVEQTRNGRIKFAEPQTLFIATELHRSLSCPVIYKSANCCDDANYDAQCGYKSALAQYVSTHNIRYLLDLHQMALHREADIDLGTGRGKNFTDKISLDMIGNAFKDCGIKNIVFDHLFSASYPYTVSSYISRTCNIQCLQIEINSALVYSASGESRIQSVINALKNIVLYLNEK